MLTPPAAATLKSLPDHNGVAVWLHGRMSGGMPPLYVPAELPPLFWYSAFADRVGGGAFDPTAREVHVGKAVSRELDLSIQGRGPSPRVLDALRSVAHELVHAASPMLRTGPPGRRDYTTTPGRFWEEGVVEHQARTFVARDLCGVPTYRVLPDYQRGAFGSQAREARAVWGVVACAPGLLDAMWQETTAAARGDVLSVGLKRELARAFDRAGVPDAARAKAAWLIGVGGLEAAVKLSSGGKHPPGRHDFGVLEESAGWRSPQDADATFRRIWGVPLW